MCCLTMFPLCSLLNLIIEQMMSEMKARLHSEYQQSKQKSLKERDHYGKSKVGNAMYIDYYLPCNY